VESSKPTLRLKLGLFSGVNPRGDIIGREAKIRVSWRPIVGFETTSATGGLDNFLAG